MKSQQIRSFYMYVMLLYGFISSQSFSQSCLPDGITFDEQSEINAFQSDYPGCSVIEGDVLIKGDITNLGGLSALREIQGRLRFYSLENLENMNGLDNLETIGGDLDIYNWPGSATSLTNLTGLEKLTSVGGDLLILGNSALISLQGLNNLASVKKGVNISVNDVLTNFSGLDKLGSIGEEVYIGESPGLTSFEGLDSLRTIGGWLEIYDCASLESLDGLEGLEHISSMLKIVQCSALQSLEGLVNLTSIDGYLEISQNNALVSLEGLDNLEASSISSLFIGENEQLSICAISSICNYIGTEDADITIYNNADGCNTTEEVESICSSNDISERSPDPVTFLYPNPTKDRIYLNLPDNMLGIQVTIFDLAGKSVHCKYHNSKSIEINGLDAGIYIVKLTCNDQCTMHKVLLY